MIRTLAAALATSTCLVALATPAAAQTREYNIPAGSLKAALDAYVRQSGRQIVYRADEVRSARSPGVRGQQSADAALTAMLAGSGFVTRVDGNLIAIVKAPARSDTGEANAGSAAANDESAEIVVTGTNIRGVKNIAAPTASYDRKDLQSSSHATLPDFFKDLPQNSATLTREAGLATGAGSLASENTQRAVGISLRGLGAQSTLVLLNGQRRPGNVNGRVFDISAIPLAVVDRVDVVTGGASAIYGADAVAGVVNLITRRDFDGAETVAYAGLGANGGDQINLSQTVGIKSDRGGFVLAGDYLHQNRLDATRAGRVLGTPSISGTMPVPDQFDLIPESKQLSGLFSGHYNITPSIEIYGDFLYSYQKNTSDLDTDFGGGFIQGQSVLNVSKQFSGVLGFKADIFKNWSIDVSTTYGKVLNHGVTDYDGFLVGADDKATLSNFRAVVEGQAFRSSFLDLKVAFGAERRHETYSLELLTGGTSTAPGVSKVTSIFGEFNMPIRLDGGIGDYTLTVSGAGRYDHYSQFGGTFNPQIGAVLSLPNGLRLRANYSEAFRAPDLLSLGFNTRAVIDTAPNPATGGETAVLSLNGGNPNLRPETAKSWSLGFDYAPPAHPWIRVSSTYFNIAHRDRIDTPGVSYSVLLASQGLVGDLLNLTPTDALLRTTYLGATTRRNFTSTPFNPATQSFVAVFPNISYYDSRLNNISSDKLSGVDGSIEVTVPIASGRIFGSLNSTYYIDYDRQVFLSGAATSYLNRPEKLVDFRMRSTLGAEIRSFEIAGHINYTDGYKDTATTPSDSIGSWTTFDLDLTWNSSRDRGILGDFSATVSVQNLFNSDPPLYKSGNSGLNYDVVNGSAVGRYISLRLRKRF